MNQEPQHHPGPTPRLDEAVVDGNADFIDACKSTIAKEAEQLGWRLGKSILTSSKDCGLVWRVDFTTPSRAGESRGCVNRLVFCESPGSDGVGLAVLFHQPGAKLE